MIDFSLTNQLIQRTLGMMEGIPVNQDFICIKSSKINRWILLTAGEFIQGHWTKI